MSSFKKWVLGVFVLLLASSMALGSLNIEPRNKVIESSAFAAIVTSTATDLGVTAGKKLAGQALDAIGLGDVAEFFGLSSGPDYTQIKLDEIIQRLDAMEQSMERIEGRLAEIQKKLDSMQSVLLSYTNINNYNFSFSDIETNVKNAQIELYRYAPNYQRVLDSEIKKSTYNDALRYVFKDFYTKNNAAFYQKINSLFDTLTSNNATKETPSISYYKLLSALGSESIDKDYIMYTRQLYNNFCQAVTICSAAMKFTLEIENNTSTKRSIIIGRMDELHDKTIRLFNYYYGDPTSSNPTSELDTVKRILNPQIAASGLYSVVHLAPGQSNTPSFNHTPSLFDRSIAWSSENPEVAIVHNGTIYGVRPGVTTIHGSFKEHEITRFVAVSNNSGANEPAVRNNKYGATAGFAPLYLKNSTQKDFLSETGINETEYSSYSWKALGSVSMAANGTISTKSLGWGLVIGSRKVNFKDGMNGTVTSWETLSLPVRVDSVDRDADGFLQISTSAQLITEVGFGADKIKLTDNLTFSTIAQTHFVSYDVEVKSTDSLHGLINEIEEDFNGTVELEESLYIAEGKNPDYYKQALAKIKEGKYPQQAIITIPFSGKFNGNNKTITMDNINANSKECVVFKTILEEGQVYNLKAAITGAPMYESDTGIASKNYGIIANCELTGESGLSPTLVIKWNNYGQELIMSSYTTISIAADNYGTIAYCKNSIKKSDSGLNYNFGRIARINRSSGIVFGCSDTLSSHTLVHRNHGLIQCSYLISENYFGVLAEDPVIIGWEAETKIFLGGEIKNSYCIDRDTKNLASYKTDAFVQSLNAGFGKPIWKKTNGYPELIIPSDIMVEVTATVSLLDDPRLAPMLLEDEPSTSPDWVWWLIGGTVGLVLILTVSWLVLKSKDHKHPTRKKADPTIAKTKTKNKKADSPTKTKIKTRTKKK